MTNQDLINYQRIAKAISYIHHHFKEQPTLETIAEHIHLSPFHFQRLFKEWTGVSPKKFLQYMNVQYAKSLLENSVLSLSEAAYDTGLSGTGRLHDLFVSIEGMTPGEYKNQGENLSINYQYENTFFGEILIASTTKGICYIGFVEDRERTFLELQKRFLNAKFILQSDEFQVNGLIFFTQDMDSLPQVKLHLKGSDFQLKVWEALLKIPLGNLNTYQNVAKSIQKPKASRAVGSAIGRNPVAFLIPCHRVIQATGALGGYMWGTTRKSAMIAWEASQVNENIDE